MDCHFGPPTIRIINETALPTPLNIYQPDTDIPLGSLDNHPNTLT